MRLQVWGTLKWLVALAVAQVTDLPSAFKVLATFMGVDMISGLALYYHRRELSSSRFGLGLAKKFGMICIVTVAHPVETLLTMEMGVTIEIGLERWIALAYIFGEVISIVENAHGLGAPIPAILVEALLKAKKTIKLADTGQLHDW